MPALKDFYAVLGVEADASPREIKSAYRARARDLHPDRNPGDASAEERFKEVQEAYATLGDETKRKAYDRARANPRGGPFAGDPFGGFAGGPPGGGRYYRAPDGTYVRVDATGAGPEGDEFVFGGGAGGGLGDLFERYFGAPGAQGPGPVPRGGRDVEATLRLSFEDALAGGPREVTLPSGETVRLTVPRGVRPGLKVRLRGRGEAAPGGRGEPGDLYVTFDVTPSARFRREGDDLVVSERISAVEALLGTAREVRTPGGQTVRVRVPPGTQPGARLRVRGQGVATDAGAGDLHVELAVSVPELADDAREALRAWADAHGLAPESTPGSRGSGG